MPRCALVVTGRELVPQFPPGRTRVATRVPHSVVSMKITATTAQARISIGGARATTGKATAQAALSVRGDYEVVLEAFSAGGEIARQSYVLHVQAL